MLWYISTRVKGHPEYPANSSMKCTETNMLDIAIFVKPQNCEVKEREYSRLIMADLFGFLSCYLSSSAGILNTFLWDLLRIWKDWRDTRLDRHCATLLNLMQPRTAQYENWKGGSENLIPPDIQCKILGQSATDLSPHCQLSLRCTEALLIFRWCCRR